MLAEGRLVNTCASMGSSSCVLLKSMKKHVLANLIFWTKIEQYAIGVYMLPIITDILMETPLNLKAIQLKQLKEKEININLELSADSWETYSAVPDYTSYYQFLSSISARRSIDHTSKITFGR